MIPADSAGAGHTVDIDPSKRLSYVIIRVAAEISDHGARAVADLGLDNRGVLVLTALAALQPTAQRHLADRVGIDRTTMVQIVDRLEASGWVARRRNRDDRRSYDLTVTAEGRKILARADEALEHCESDFVAALSAKERQTLLAILLRLPHKSLDFGVEA